MNLNRLLPRISIRLKLVVAFALLAVLPVAAVAGFTVRYAVRQARIFTTAVVEYDLALAKSQMEQSLIEVERDVAYLSAAQLGPDLSQSDKVVWEETGRLVSTFLAFETTLFQIKAVDRSGRVLLVARRAPEANVVGEAGDGLYYSHQASQLMRGQRLLLPVELRGPPTDRSGLTSTTPAIAIVVPVRDSADIFRGAVVGEAYASDLLSGVEISAPNLRGVTGLVNSDGHFLYHSVRKSDWANLLATRSEVGLSSEVSSDVVDTMLGSDQPGTVLDANRNLVSWVQLQLAGSGFEPLILYRWMYLSEVDIGIPGSLRWVFLGGVATLLLVIVMGFIAAHQFTSPVYQLQMSARQLAAGNLDTELDVATNDELEDLAEEFSRMARTIVDQRRRLESLVTERTRALDEMAAEMSGILEGSADAIVGVDSQGRIRVWNSGARALFGYALDEAIGQHIDYLILPDGDHWRSEADFIWSRLGAGEVLNNYRTLRIDRDGRLFPVSMTQTPIRDRQGRRFGYALIIRDTSAQEKLEEQMRRSERLAAMSVLTGGLAHELGNPLTVIVSRLELMQRKALRTNDKRLLGDLEILDKNAARLDGLIRDFLESFREEPDEIQSVQLNAIVESVVGLLERSHRARGIRLATDLEAGLPAFDGSEKAVQTVCINLVLNALDATPQGGTVTIRTRLRDECRLELAVVDTGCGIPEEYRTRVFEPFFTTKRSGEGTGLGLAVCRAIVDKHGGSITIKSEPGEGSQFVASFQIHRFE